tara:strand:+ start:5893 stop:6282 length:390 start_codon:yes stop_codon:yes gene_type:complete
MIFLLSLAFANIPEYTYIEAGEPAPFSGRLFNDEASQLLADEIADATEKCQIQMDYQIGMLLALKQEEMAKLKSDHRYEKQVLESKVSTLESRVEELEALKTPPKRQFWFVTGLVSGIALTISIAKAVE